MSRKLQTNNHCRNLLLYHFIFVCKYRKSCFLNKEFGEALKREIIRISDNYDFSIDTIELDYSKPDHIHILVRSNPNISPLQICRVLKQQTNVWAWGNYKDYLRNFYKRNNHLWTRGYFVSSVGNVSADVVQHYLEKQGGRKNNA